METIFFIMMVFSGVCCHVDDVFYVSSSTATSVIVGWYGEDGAVNRVARWTVAVDGDVKYVGSASQLESNGEVEVRVPNVQPGEVVHVNVTAEKTDGSSVHSLFNKRYRLKPLPVRELTSKIQKTALPNDQAGSVSLHWSMPEENSVQDHYTVRYKGTLVPSNWSNYEDTYTTSLSLSGLVPGNIYRFQVFAVSDDTASVPLEVEEALFPGHVTEVRAESTPNGEGVRVRWTKPPGTYRYLDVETEKPESGEKVGKVIIAETDDEANVRDLQPGHTYIVHICAVGWEGKKGQIVDSPVSTAPVITSTLTLEGQASETSVTLVYTQTEATFDYYNIKITKEDKSVAFFVKQKDDLERKVTFSKLEPGTHYTAKINTAVGEYAGAGVSFSPPHTLTFQTAGDAAKASDLSVPLEGVIGGAVVLAICLIALVVLIILLVKFRRHGAKPDNPEKKIALAEIQRNGVGAHTRSRIASDLETNRDSTYADIAPYEPIRESRQGSTKYEEPVTNTIPYEGLRVNKDEHPYLKPVYR